MARPADGAYIGRRPSLPTCPNGAGTVNPLSEAAMREALHLRGARMRRIIFKRNRSRLLSVSHDGATVHLHDCFRSAPPLILDALAIFLTESRSSPARLAAARQLREWPGSRQGILAARSLAAPAAALGRSLPRPGPCAGTPRQRRLLAELYARLNQLHFGGRLPRALPVRISRRMTRLLGHVRYGRSPAGTRVVVEIALSADLLLDGNGAELRETLLHEMAHAEAWLFHGHGGHGRPWKRIAARVGCEARACTKRSIQRPPRR